MFDNPKIVELLLTQWKEPSDGSQVYTTYGITQATRDRIAALQSGLCSICRWGEPLVVDHCHATNRVRGLICGACNTLLGRLRDSPSALRARADMCDRAAAYLEFMAGIGATGGYPEDAEWPRVPSPFKRALRPDLLDDWPHRRLHVVPRKRATMTPAACRIWETGRIVAWTPNDKLTNWEAGPSGFTDPETQWVYGLKGIAETARWLLRCDSPEKSLAFYARSFLRTYRDRIVQSHGYRDYLADWLNEESSRFLEGDDHPWHTNSGVVLPDAHLGYGPLGLGDFDELETEQDLLDLLLIHWSHVTTRWTILEIVADRSRVAA